MSFVAQPYSRFVDDLLTALTGGVTREEHRFDGVDSAYSLTTPGAMPASVQVYGQRQEAYTVFATGIDYRFDAPSSQIHWLPEGKPPDLRSYFYVNYQVPDAPRRLTDRNPGSVTTTLAEAFGRELAALHQQMQMIYQAPFLDLSADSALDHVVALLGLSRRDSRFATGEVLFARTTPAPGDILIPAGTLVSTGRGENFATTDQRTLRKGQLAVTAPIRAVAESPAGQVDAGAIVTLNRPVFGLDSVSNPKPTTFANRKETDDELRRRARAALERAGRSTLQAIKYGLIEDVPEIGENNIQVIERPETPGLVEVKLGVANGSDPDFVRRVEEAIFAARPAGVRVIHNLPTRTAGVPEANADRTMQGEAIPAAHLPDEVLRAMPEGLVTLRVEVLLRLAEPNLSAGQKESIEEDVRAQVLDYLNALPMGATLVYSKMLGRVVRSDKIADATLSMGAAGDPSIYQVNLATDGRKATADPSQVFVGLMDESVFLDVRLAFEPSPAATAAAGGAPLTVTAALHSALEAAVRNGCAQAREGGTLRQADVRAAVAAVLHDNEPRLQLAPGDAVTVNAEYEETGRLLNNTQEVALEPHQVPVLRNLTAQVRGPLDE